MTASPITGGQAGAVKIVSGLLELGKALFRVLAPEGPRRVEFPGVEIVFQFPANENGLTG